MIRVRLVLSIVFASLAAAYLLAFIHPFGDPSLVSTQGSPQRWGKVAMTPAARDILSAKCADCHSFQTRQPIYAHFAPASWLIERDVIQARRSLNLSQWDDDSPDDREQLIAEVSQAAKKREMPPLQYLVLHWNARLGNDDIRTLADWAQANAPEGGSQSNEPQGDAARGKLVFEKRCTGCHALDRDREGPHLRGVYGRTAGTVAGFDYSDALKNSHVVWDGAILNRWLTNPDAMVSGVNMDFYLAKPEERADVIEFLKEQSQKVKQ